MRLHRLVECRLGRGIGGGDLAGDAQVVGHLVVAQAQRAAIGLI